MADSIENSVVLPGVDPFIEVVDHVEQEGVIPDADVSNFLTDNQEESNEEQSTNGI